MQRSDSVTEAGAWVAEWSSGSPATKLNRPLRERIFVCVLMGMAVREHVEPKRLPCALTPGWMDLENAERGGPALEQREI